LEEIGGLWKVLQGGRGREWVKQAEKKEKKMGDGIARLGYAKEGWSEVRDGLG
jgi:hypothetical protein